MPHMPMFVRHSHGAVKSIALSLLAGVITIGCKSGEKQAALDSKLDVAAPTAPAATYDHELGLETFDAAWQYVHDTHFDTTFNGVDWQSVHVELRPNAEAAANENELRAVIMDMLSRLGQSHFALLPRDVVDSMNDPEPEAPSAAADAGADASTAHAANSDSEQPELSASDGNREGDIGIKFAIIAREAVVTRVDPTGPAAKAGVESGWVIDEINGHNVASRMVENLSEHVDEATAKYETMQRVAFRLYGKPGSTIKLTMRDSNDKPVELELKRRVRPGQIVQFGNLPPMNALLERERLTSDAGEDVGLIRFNIWMIVLIKPFNDAIDELRDTSGIVLDLRGNPGGVGGMAMSLAGHFFNDENTLGVMKTRAGELHFNISPKRLNSDAEIVEPFAGPVAILVDHGTASTSEIFAAGMQSIGRARVFGETSAGAALPALMDRLPNGDVLLHAFADFILPTGHSVEGVGVVPDEPVVLSRKDLIGDRDPVLEAAMKWIAAETKKQAVAVNVAR